VRDHLRAAFTLTAAAALLALASKGAYGYFERFAVSSRVQSMGGAFVSVADDASAVVLNPAGLSSLRTPGVLSTISEPYGLTDLREYFVAAAVPTRFVNVGISWHHFGLDGVTSENLFTLALGRDIVRTSQDASLSVGAGIDVARVAYSDDEIGASETVLTGSLAVLLRPFPFVGAGYTVRHLGSPSFDFGLPPWPNPTGIQPGTARLETTHTFGFAYHRNNTFSVLYERERGQDEKWRNRLGFEIKAGEHLRIRSGLAGRDVGGGLGVTWSRVTIDAGVTSHGALGLSYVVTAGVALPGGESDGEEW
jgi:hypothetical protein